MRHARTPQLIAVGRTGLIGRGGRAGRQGLGTELLGGAVNTQRLSHRARRRIASPPMRIVERVVTAVGEALARWSARFIDRVMADVVKTDATVDELFAALDDPQVARKLLEQAFEGLDSKSSDDLRVIGIQTSEVVQNAQRLQSEWVTKSTNLIRATDDVRARVKSIIEGPLAEGRSVDEIRKLLEEQAGYARSRAELTARDQTLKLYGKIQEERQVAAGFTQYVWTTSLDERVRHDHAVLDGAVIDWDDPPIVDVRTGRRAHPGGDYSCRCSAVPWIGTEAEPEPLAQPDTEVQRFTAERTAAEAAQARVEAERA